MPAYDYFLFLYFLTLSYDYVRYLVKYMARIKVALYYIVDTGSIQFVNSLMPSDAYMCQYTNHHWFR